MSTARHRKARRSEDFAVRRWLHAGAVTAGMGAALLGFGLLGAEIATAAADTGSESASSGATNAGPSAGEDRGSTTSDADASDAASDSGSGATGTADNADADTDTDTDDDEADADAVAVAERVSVKPKSHRATAAAETESDDATAESEDAAAEADDGAAADSDDTTAVAEPPVRSTANVDSDEEPADEDEYDWPVAPAPYVSPQSAYQIRVAEILDDWTARHQEWVDSLQISDERKERMQESFLAMRRTFFNQAPTVAPVQITGVLTGAVTGNLGGDDPDGDRLVYILTKAPTSGSVTINRDGTYSYTPGDDFNGVDTFRVAAIDLGLHMNLLQLLRPVSSGVATSLINQGAIKLEFTDKTSSDDWNAERLAALREAAEELIEYFRVTAPVTLTYDLTEDDDDDDSTLASAGSALVQSTPGFWKSVVQQKLQDGVDANGDAADGEIEWNWNESWGLGDDIADDEYDFKAVLRHEMLHSFGFTGRIRTPDVYTKRNWSTYASFVSDKDGEFAIGEDFRWDSAFNPNLTGGNGGLFFGGPTAVAVYGRPVPLFTPDPFENGSSTSHTDDETFKEPHQLLMNHATGKGPSVREISAIEAGILIDLGYIVVQRHEVD